MARRHAGRRPGPASRLATTYRRPNCRARPWRGTAGTAAVPAPANAGIEQRSGGNAPRSAADTHWPTDGSSGGAADGLKPSCGIGHGGLRHHGAPPRIGALAGTAGSAAARLARQTARWRTDRPAWRPAPGKAAVCTGAVAGTAGAAPRSRRWRRRGGLGPAECGGAAAGGGAAAAAAAPAAPAAAVVAVGGASVAVGGASDGAAPSSCWAALGAASLAAGGGAAASVPARSASALYWAWAPSLASDCWAVCWPGRRRRRGAGRAGRLARSGVVVPASASACGRRCLVGKLAVGRVVAAVAEQPGGIEIGHGRQQADTPTARPRIASVDTGAMDAQDLGHAESVPGQNRFTGQRVTPQHAHKPAFSVYRARALAFQARAPAKYVNS